MTWSAIAPPSPCSRAAPSCSISPTRSAALSRRRRRCRDVPRFCSGCSGRWAASVPWPGKTTTSCSMRLRRSLTPSSATLARLHQLAGFGEAKPLESLGREFKGRHYTGSEGSGGRAEGRGRDFWWGLGGEVELQALQQEYVVVFRRGMAGQDERA